MIEKNNKVLSSFLYRVIDQLVHIGTTLGCYKIILDCAEKNVDFYQKCGFQKKEVQMVAYLKKSRL